MKAADREALRKWEELRHQIRSSTPVNRNETHTQKMARIARLEADPQAWKQYYFPKYFKYKSPDFHIRASKRIHSALKKNKHHYEVRHWARGLAKSTTAMFDIMYFALTGNLKNIVLTSSTKDAATEHLTKYMAQLDSNQRIIEDYGLQERSGAWTLGDFTTQKGVKFLALGAGQSPRGTSNEEIRPDCIIVDDFDTDEECRNSDIIQKKWDWYEKALFYTVDIANPFLIIWLGNIIAEDCCVVRAGKVADHCEIINIRDENGKSVWDKNSEADIDFMISKTSYEASQQEFFNNPMRTGKAFPEIIFGKVPRISEPPFMLIYCDPSTSNKDKPTTKSGASNSCKAVVILSFKGQYRYIHKAFVDHANMNTFIEWVFAASDYCKGAKVLYRFIENNSLQDPFYTQVINPLIQAKNKERGTSVHLIPDTRAKGDKYTRIEATLEPINRNGLLILNEQEKNNPHFERLVAQFKSASPNSKTMDAPDAVEGGVFIINNKAASLQADISVRPYNPKYNKKRF